MAAVYQGPVPTRLVFLSSLVSIAEGEKVRFLGCVTNYNTSSAVLTLEHSFPPGDGHKALVDVKLLLGTLKSTDTSIGEWVNVTGYVTLSPPQKKTNGASSHVQAILLWSAGPIKLDDYEKTLTERLQLST